MERVRVVCGSGAAGGGRRGRPRPVSPLQAPSPLPAYTPVNWSSQLVDNECDVGCAWRAFAALQHGCFVFCVGCRNRSLDHQAMRYAPGLVPTRTHWLQPYVCPKIGPRPLGPVRYAKTKRITGPYGVMCDRGMAS